MSSIFDNRWHSSDPGGSEAKVVRMVISYPIVVIRLCCKITKAPSKLAMKNLSWDDLFIVLALLSSTIGQGAVFWGLPQGGSGMLLPKLVMQGHYDGVSNFLLANFIGGMSDYITLTLIRLSILAFYHNIFKVHEKFHVVSMVMAIITIVWTITCVFAHIFMCTPVNHLWKPLSPGICRKFPLFYVIVGSFETAMDATILALPIVPLLQLSLLLRTRLSIIGIFLLGAFVVLTNILRIKFMYQPGTHYIDLQKATLWISVHITSAFACACLPLCRAFVLKFVEMTNSFSQYARSLRSRNRSKSGGDDFEYWRDTETTPNQGDASSEIQSFQLEGYHSSASFRLGGTNQNYKAGVESHEAIQNDKQSWIPKVNEFEVV